MPGTFAQSIICRPPSTPSSCTRSPPSGSHRLPAAARPPGCSAGCWAPAHAPRADWLSATPRGSASFRSCSMGLPGKLGSFSVPVSSTVGTSGSGNAASSSLPLARVLSISAFCAGLAPASICPSIFSRASHSCFGSFACSRSSSRPSSGSTSTRPATSRGYVCA